MFSTRHQAGMELARALRRFAQPVPVVLALARGGLPVGRVVADQLSAHLDVLIIRKLGAPHNPEFAFGAVGEGGVLVLDDASITGLGLSDVVRDRVIAETMTEVDRRVDTYRHGRALMDLQGKTVIIVDDGLATGATAEAAIRVVQKMGASYVVLAVPTGSRQAVDRLAAIANEVICLEIPEWFGSVGSQYESFPQVSDNQVVEILRA